jgi:hypothetical protein
VTERIFDHDQGSGGAWTRRTFLGGTTAFIAGTVVSGHGQKAIAALSASAAAVDCKAPVLLRISDAVKPGQLFSVNGEWLDAENVEVFVAIGSEAGEAPPSHALTAPIVQTDEQGHFLVASLPPQMPPGAFTVWVRNSAGCSASISMNHPRPLYLSEYEAWAGQQMKIIGRNFDPAEFGAAGRPHVRLVNDVGGCFTAQVINHNPYAITFRVPEAAVTRYWVEASIDGKGWRRPPASEALKIVSAGKDPLGLGVAWADKFQWHRVCDVTKSGVPTNGGDDVTAQVQKVVETAKAAGGGVVYFPAGRYELSRIALPADIVLLGAGAKKTTLVSASIGGNFIDSSGDGAIAGRQGVACLSIETRNPNVRPDIFISLGEPWGQNNNVSDLRVRTAAEMFVKSVNLNYPLTGPAVTTGQRGIGVEWIGKQRAICEDCNFVGYHAQPYISMITDYYSVKRNYFEYSTGYIVCCGSRSFYENNRIVGHRKHSAVSGDYDLHGLFARDRAYMANNVVDGVGSLSSGMGDDNDGEALCVEVPDAAFNYGSVTAASETTLTVNPQVPLIAPQVSFGHLSVAIIDGRGLGQLRRVIRVDSQNNELTIEHPWDVIPDATSAFTLILPLEQVTFFRNSATDCTKGMWFFGNTYDSVMAENNTTDCEGLSMWTVRTPGVFVPGYFARFARNRVVGVSAKTLNGGISYDTGRYDQNGAYFGTQAYGIEMLDNFVSGNPGSIPVPGVSTAPPYPGLTLSAATYSSQYDGNPAGADGKNNVLARNKLSKLATGITITHSLSGTLIADNTYTSTVGTFLEDSGSMNTDEFKNKQV